MVRTSEINRLNAVQYRIGSTAAIAEAFLKWGGAKPMTRFSSPTTKAGCGVARKFKRGTGHNFHIFVKRIFFGGTNLKLIEKEEKL